MKKLAVIMGIFLSTALWGQNLLLNPGFELWDTNSVGQDSFPTSWNYSTSGSLTNLTFKKVEGYTGYAFQVSYGGNPSGWDFMITQLIDISSFPITETLVASVRIKSFGNNNLRGRLWFSFYRTDNTFVSGAGPDNYTDPSSTSWQVSSYKFTRTSEERSFVRFEVRLYKSNPNIDSVLIDDAYLSPTIKDVEVLNISSLTYVVLKNTENTFTVKFKNNGPSSLQNVKVKYYHKIHDLSDSIWVQKSLAPNGIDSISFSVNYNFTGCDTLVVLLKAPGDTVPLNDSVFIPIEVWPESTMAAATFNSEEFPPNGWSRVIVSGDYNWKRYTVGEIVTGDAETRVYPIEGAGMAGYPFFEAEEGNSARLITNTFNVGDARKRVVLRFYMTHSNFYSGYDDSLIVEYKIGSNFIRVSGFAREMNIPGAGYVWLPHEVVLGDFSGDSSLAVSLLAVSDWGENMFVDSVWVFTAAPGPEFVFNENTDIGKFTMTDNYWVRIKPENSSYGIDSCFSYYELSSKAFTQTPRDSIVDGYYYFTIENPTPGQNHSVSYYFEFYDDSPWKYCNRYPLTGTLSYNILPITDKLPTSYALGLKGSNISPGLFNISYAIPERSLVEISVYSVNGRKIATLVKGTKDTGYYTVRWDGRSDTGSRVGSGIYIIKMETPKKIFTEKLIITR